MNLRTLLTEAHDISNFKKIGPALGSNPGGTYQDLHGTKWYVKHSLTPDHAKNEYLAHLIYKETGTPVIDLHLIRHNGRLGVASKIETLRPNDFREADSKDRQEAQHHFASHALVANWDAPIGDNLVHTHRGLTTLDTGGALLYRAMGTPKGRAWNDRADEFFSMRNPNRNPKSAHVFGNMSSDTLRDSVRRMSQISDNRLRDLSMEHGPGDEIARRDLGETLVRRKHNIIKYSNQV